MAKRDDSLGALFGAIAVWPAVGMALAGALSIAWQIRHWLKYAEWQPLHLRDAISYVFGSEAGTYQPNTGYLGVDQILSWSLDGSPLALWAMLILPFCWIGLAIGLLSSLSPK